MKINVDCFDKYVELQFPTEYKRLTYGEAEELKNKLINSLENYQKHDILSCRFFEEVK